MACSGNWIGGMSLLLLLDLSVDFDTIKNGILLRQLARTDVYCTALVLVLCGEQIPEVGAGRLLFISLTIGLWRFTGSILFPMLLISRKETTRKTIQRFEAWCYWGRFKGMWEKVPSQCLGCQAEILFRQSANALAQYESQYGLVMQTILGGTLLSLKNLVHSLEVQPGPAEHFVYTAL